MLLASCISAAAMDEKMEQVNAIKKSHDYLYGEATMKTLAEAEVLAFELLQTEVDVWLSSAAAANPSAVGTSSIETSPVGTSAVIGDLQPVIGDLQSPTFPLRDIADTLVLRRAEMYRVFAFVKKDALLSGKTEPHQPSPQKVPEVRSTPPFKMQRDELMSKEAEKVIKQRFSLDKEAVRRIKQARNFFELRTILPPLKEQGLIADYGKYATAEHPETCYLIIYDAAGNIKALLGTGEEIRPNLLTGQPDSIDNYRGCGAIWFK